jgi:CHAT domain-containing protein
MHGRFVEFDYERRLGLAALVDASRDLRFRTIAPRLGGRFPYRPLRAATRRATDDSLADPALLPIYEAAAHVMSRASSAPSATSLHALGVAQLLTGSAVRACTSLERAALTATSEADVNAAIARLDDSRLLADLAAGYYERGVGERRPELILSAIDVAMRAQRIDPQLAQAAFTRALATERIHTARQAVSAWDAYLQIETDKDWAAEARARRAALASADRPVGRPGRDTETVETRATRIEADLLPAWADAYLAGGTLPSEQALAEAAREGKLLLACCGDAFHTRSVESIARAIKSDHKRALLLAAAHRDYRNGRQLYAENKTSAAAPLLASARDAFREEGDVFALKPWKYLAASHLYLGDAKLAAAEAAAAAQFGSDLSCGPAALAHLRWVQAITAGRSGDPQRALAFYEEALQGFEEGKEADNAASIHSLIAENLEFLGASDEAWPHREIALRAAERNGTLDRLYIAFNEAADAAFRRRHLASARAFQDVVVDAAKRENNTALLADALLWRGRISSAAGDSRAHADWLEADHLSNGVTDPQRQARLLAGIAAARAETSPPAAAIEHLTRAIGFFTAAENHYRLAELYAARAEAEETLSQRDLAEADFIRCIAELESERSGVTNPALRERYFAKGSTVFDRAIRHLWIRGRHDDAFQLAEQSRGREALGASLLPARSVRDVQGALRPGDAILEYAVLEDRLIVWIMTPLRSVAVERPLPAGALGAAIAAMRTALESEGDLDEATDRLSAILYAPVAAAVKEAKRLVVVANKGLRAIPFAALRDADSHRYLVEDHEIVIASSAAVYLRALERGRSIRHREPLSVLLVASTDGDAARRLPPLPRGADEIAAVQGTYGSVQIIAEQEALPLRVLSKARDAAVLHIVAHSVDNEEHPEYASIVLAPSPEGRDLYARNIASASLPATRIVFLSSCGTPGRLTHNDAPLTLPESFLSAGVPVVIGALRPVDDADTASFAASFHRAFKATGDAVASLRSVQLQRLASQKAAGVRFWSSWVAIGGGD